MGRRRAPKRALTLEEKLAAMPPRPTLDPREPWMDRAGSLAQVQWDRERAALREAIKARDAKRMRDPGKDASGNFGVSPFAGRGAKIEIAPKELRSTPDSSFPQRRADRVYERLSALSAVERRAADALWETWSAAETGDRLTAAYSPVSVQTSNGTGHLVEKRLDAAMTFLDLKAMIPVRCLGVVMHVVVCDFELADWGLKTAKSESTRRRHGTKLLKRGLQAIAARLGY